MRWNVLDFQFSGHNAGHLLCVSHGNWELQEAGDQLLSASPLCAAQGLRAEGAPQRGAELDCKIREDMET